MFVLISQDVWLLLLLQAWEEYIMTELYNHRSNLASQVLLDMAISLIAKITQVQSGNSLMHPLHLYLITLIHAHNLIG